MANLSPQARAKLAALTEFSDRVQRVYGLVELYATTKANREQYLPAIARGFTDLRYKFMGAGMDDLSQLAAAMTLAAKRGVSHTAKIRILRDGVGSMRFQMEMEQRAVRADDEAEQNRAAAEAREEAEGLGAASRAPSEDEVAAGISDGAPEEPADTDAEGTEEPLEAHWLPDVDELGLEPEEPR